MDLFTIENNRAFPSSHALLIEPFKTIWDMDETEGKSEAIKTFSYIELLSSPKKSNPFRGYAEEVRPGKVKKEVWGDENYEHDNVSLIIQAVHKYKSLLMSSSPSYFLYLSALNAKDELVRFFNSINLQERTGGGAAVYKPKDITAALREVGEVTKSLATVEEKMYDELEQDSKLRNQRTVGAYEN